MKAHHISWLVLGLLAVLASASSATVATAAEVRGTVMTVEAGARVWIKLPRGAVVSPGDEVRIEAPVPGIAPVQIRGRWRVKLVGEGFAIAEPVDMAGGTPLVGYTAVVGRGASAAAPAAAEVPTLPQPQRPESSSTRLAALERAAEGGDVRAMWMLAMHHHGHIDTFGGAARPNKDEAARWYGRAADKGDVLAMKALGLLKRTQPGEAETWFRKAAEKGDTEGMYQLSKFYAQAGDAASRYEWARRAAEKGHIVAVFELGEMYLFGAGVKRDPVEAVRWYRKSADWGFPNAMITLATLYRNGTGVARSMRESFRWTSEAAESGNAWSMYALGHYYLAGWGTAVNHAEAKRWFQQAADNGEPEGMFGVSLIHHYGLTVRRDPALAADWVMKALRAGSFQAARRIMAEPRLWSPDFRKELQSRLRDAGFYRGEINGRMDLPTRQAIAELTKTVR